MELANRAFDLVVKIAVILAAVAAINLLGEKPRLVAVPTCHVSVNMGVFKRDYVASGRATPAWLVHKINLFNGTGVINYHRAPTVPSGVTLLSARGFFERTPLTQRSACAPIVLDSPAPVDVRIKLPRPITGVFDGRYADGEAEQVLRHGRPMLNPWFEAQLLGFVREGGTLTLHARRLLDIVRPVEATKVDDLARSAVAAATTIRADVRVDNRGQGGATNVRVEPPPSYAPIDAPSPFDLASGEGRTLHFSVTRDGLFSAPQTPQFRPFGTKRQASTRLSS